MVQELNFAITYQGVRKVKTVALPDGSVVPVVDIKVVQDHRHFWKSNEYYVQVVMRDGKTQDVLGHLSGDAAQVKRDELMSLIQQAWDEIEPYEHGYQAGHQRGRSEGHSDGFAAGKSEGYHSGRIDGWDEGRNSIISYLVERREGLMREQAAGELYPPSRRRYVRIGIGLLTNIIHYVRPESPGGSDY
jgi:hypothetical protein